MNAETSELGIDAAAAARYREIAASAAQGELVFSSSAELGLRIKHALDDPEGSVDQIAKLIQAEPLLAARVVAVANSVAYNSSGRKIADVRQAVARLGFGTLRSLVMSMLVKQISGQPTDERLKALIRQLWEHTAHVSALARVIARRVTHLDPETALFAGILHEVAGFYLISRAAAVPELGADMHADWQGGGEVIVGSVLLKALEVPEAIAQAIADLWEGYLAHPPTSLGDTLLLAEQLAPVPSPLYWAPEKNPDSETDKPHIELIIDQETLTGILEESAAEVRSLLQALS